MRTTYRHGDETIALDVQRREASHFTASVGERTYEIDATLVNPATLQLTIDGRTVIVHVARRSSDVHVVIDGVAHVLTVEAGTAASGEAGARVSPEVTAPMPGKVLRVFVREGQTVVAGDDLLILEAMKMETRITADGPGTVRKVSVAEGQMVDGGQVMVEVDYQAPAAE